MVIQSDTRERLFDISLDLFGRRGYGSVSIREICREAGIRESSFYNHYPSKQSLLERVITEVGAYMHSPRLLERQPECWSRMSLAELLDGGISLFMEGWSHVRLRRLWIVLSHEQYRSDAVAVLMANEQAFRIACTAEMFQSLMTTGRMRADDPRRAATLYVHAISSLKLEYVRNLHHDQDVSVLARLMREVAAHFAEQWAPRHHDIQEMHHARR
jgi:AcrR family transcriptional regulator